LLSSHQLQLDIQAAPPRSSGADPAKNRAIHSPEAMRTVPVGAGSAPAAQSQPGRRRPCLGIRQQGRAEPPSA
jgi:hypothetical protein